MSTLNSDWPTRRNELERNAEDLANQFEMPGENFQIGVDEALLFSNNPRLWNEYVRDDANGIVGALKQKGDRTAQVDAAFWSILSRAPFPEERSACDDFLGARDANPTAALRQFVWSLLASPEFRFNH